MNSEAKDAMNRSYKDQNIKFSLILATINRAREIKVCLESLKAQTYKNFEVIIIDQSENEETEVCVKNGCFEGMSIQYYHVCFRGLSKARNYGLQRSHGDYFCLIDDDAFYPSEYLCRVRHYIDEGRKTILSGYIWNPIENTAFVNYNALRHGNKLNVRQIIRYCPSPCMSFPMTVINEAGLFDEEFGVGAKYGCGEETDLILRCLKKGYFVKYYQDVEIEHPNKALNIPPMKMTKEKAYSYSRGIGAMICKHIQNSRMDIILWFCFAEMLAKDFVKMLLLRTNGKQKFFGKINGFISYHNR